MAFLVEAFLVGAFLVGAYHAEAFQAVASPAWAFVNSQLHKAVVGSLLRKVEHLLDIDLEPDLDSPHHRDLADLAANTKFCLNIIVVIYLSSN